MSYVCAPILLGLLLILAGCERGPRNRELTESLLIQKQVADVKSLYFTQPVSEAQRDERVSMYAQAARDPQYWRQLDRRFRFEGVLLLGDPAGYRPLINHLRNSADWVLTYLDHIGIVYRRAPAEPWDPGSLEKLAQRFAAPKEKTVFYVQTAGRLLAVGNVLLAQKQLQAAQALEPNSAELWAQFANLYIHMSKWKEGLESAERALKERPDYGPALSIKAQLLLAAKQPGKAFEVSTRLIQVQPKDPTALFLHARLAHAANAYGSEIEALEQLVALAEKEKQSSTGYRLYLGQAYAARGQAQPAMDEFQKVLGAGDANEEQRQFASQLLEQIRSRSY